MFEPGKHAANFAILAFRENDFEDRHISTACDDPCAPGPDFALSQPDPFGQLVDDLLARISSDRNAISLFDTVARMREPLSQSTVIGQKHQAFTVPVEPADDEDAFTCLGNEIQDERPAGWVLRRAYITLRLVDQIMHVRLRFDALAVHRDFRSRGIDLRAEFTNDLAIDRHPAFQYQEFASPARTDTCLSQHLMQPIAAGRCLGIRLRCPRRSGLWGRGARGFTLRGPGRARSGRFRAAFGIG